MAYIQGHMWKRPSGTTAYCNASHMHTCKGTRMDHTRTHTCTHTHMHAHTYTRTHTCMYARTHTHTHHTNTRTQTHAHTRMHTRTHTRTHTHTPHTHTHTHTHAHTHTHTRARTHTHTSGPQMGRTPLHLVLEFCNIALSHSLRPLAVLHTREKQQPLFNNISHHCLFSYTNTHLSPCTYSTLY